MLGHLISYTLLNSIKGLLGVLQRTGQLPSNALTALIFDVAQVPAPEPLKFNISKRQHVAKQRILEQ
jgi:hypothetical protein